MNDRQLLDVEALASFLGVKPSWVYGKVAAKELPCVRVGRYLRFDRDRVLRELEAGRQAAKAAQAR